jgi:hypothetical protein
MKAYEVIALAQTPIEWLIRNGINPSSVKHLGMFYEYRRMVEEGWKKTYIVACLCDKYEVGRTKFFELIGEFEREMGEAIVG